MLNKPNPFLFTVFLILIYGCGFKFVDKSKLINFKIDTIVTSGEKRLNYKIKNKVLLSSNDQSNRRIQIDLKSERKKSVKEKNSSKFLKKIKKKQIKRNNPPVSGIFSFVVNFWCLSPV